MPLPRVRTLRRRPCAYGPCGKTFQARRPNQRFCNARCRRAWWGEQWRNGIPHKCSHCGVLHEPNARSSA